MPRSSRPVTVMPIVVRQVHVLEVVDLTPSMQRIVVTGDELRGGDRPGGGSCPPFTSLGFDDHVKLVFTGDHPRSWIGAQQEYAFDWNREALSASRDYTVRSYDERTNRLTLDVVRHEHGVAADWFAACAPGDTFHLAGPKTSMPIIDGVDSWLLLGDETALPAIARFFDEVDAEAHVRAIIEVPTLEDRQPLRELPHAEVTWLPRDGVAPGCSDALMRALAALDQPTGRVHAWCAGEALTLTPIRRHLRTVWNLPKEDVEVVGYWRRPAKPATDTTDSAPDARLQAMHALHEMTEMLPPVVTRLAATFDISTHVASGHGTLVALAQATSLDPLRLESLLDAMTSLGLLTRSDGRYGVTDTGALLAEEDVRDELTLTDPANRLWLDLLGLDDVIREGIAPERTLSQRRRHDRELDAALEAQAQELVRYLFDPLAELDALQGARHVLVVGEAAAHVAHELSGRLSRARVTCEEEDVREPDVVLSVGHFAEATPDVTRSRAEELLSRARQALVAVENLRDDAHGDDHLAEADLQNLASSGVPLPTSARLEETFRTAGARRTATVHPGWGFGTYNAVVVADV